MKLDRSLLAGLESDEARQAMIVGLRHFARSVGCRLIAEGIESDVQARELERLGCTHAQGYLFSRPLSIQLVSETPNTS